MVRGVSKGEMGSGFRYVRGGFKSLGVCLRGEERGKGRVQEGGERQGACQEGGQR